MEEGVKMAGCGCAAGFEAGLWETMKWGALFGAKKGILKGSALGAGYGSLGGPLGTYVGGYVGGVIGGALGTALGGLIGAGGAWGAHILFSQCGCSPLCLCFPSRWQGPQPAPARPDPLVLDLNRDGKVELKNAAFFDLNANGFHESTRWIDKTDAFLVLDKNFNGKADDGSELFGDHDPAGRVPCPHGLRRPQGVRLQRRREDRRLRRDLRLAEGFDGRGEDVEPGRCGSQESELGLEGRERKYASRAFSERPREADVGGAGPGPEGPGTRGGPCALEVGRIDCALHLCIFLIQSYIMDKI